MAISPLELRHIIESGMLPLQCRCTVDDKKELSIELVDPTTGNNYSVGGIALAQLGSSRAISNLIAQLKADMQSITMASNRNTG